MAMPMPTMKPHFIQDCSPFNCRFIKDVYDLQHKAVQIQQGQE